MYRSVRKKRNNVSSQEAQQKTRFVCRLISVAPPLFFLIGALFSLVVRLVLLRLHTNSRLFA